MPLFLIFTGILIILGSLGVFKDYCIPLSITNTLLFLGIKLIKGIKIQIPNNFKLYLIFLAVLLAHTLLFDGIIIWFWMFLSGGLYWLSIYNIRDFVNKYFSSFLYFLGILMVFIYIYFKLKGVTFLSPDNLFLPIRADILHNHIGDLWAIILVSIFYKTISKFKSWHIPFIITGIIMVAMSLSRSAVLTLAIGIVYIIYKLNLHTKKSIVALATLVCFSLFIYFSIYKSTLFARPYFYEAIKSTVTSPMGIGMANFAKASPETNVVHNLVLEVVCGMGVFSSIFVFWLYKIGKDIYMSKNINIEFAAIFIALFVNFFFDSTYVIPGMSWIWFATLALL
jgi:branched-subunit amino acid transport protein